jgi:hypothetical protein
MHIRVKTSEGACDERLRVDGMKVGIGSVVMQLRTRRANSMERVNGLPVNDDCEIWLFVLLSDDLIYLMDLLFCHKAGRSYS